MSRRAARVVTTVVAASVALALVWSPAASGVPVDLPAAPNTTQGRPNAAATRVFVSVSSVTGSTVTVSGRLVDQANRPLPGQAIAIRLDGAVVQTVQTGAQGEFAAQTPFPVAGPHTVQAVYGGSRQLKSSDASASFVVAAAPFVPTETTAAPAPTTTAPAPPPGSPVALTATIAPTTAYPGAIIEVTGTLLMNGAPLAGAPVDITVDWGGGTANTVTGESGAFSAAFTLPTTGTPPQVSVALAFAGEDGVPAAAGNVAVPVGAAPATSAAPTPSASRTTATAAPITALTTAAPSSAPPPPKQQSTSGGDMTRTVGTIIGFVALAALATLLTLWLVAFGGHRLLTGERRGFGSDFGAKTSADPGDAVPRRGIAAGAAEDVRQD